MRSSGRGYKAKSVAMMSSNSDALKAYFSKLGGPENGLTIPDQYSKVWKDECMLCFCSCLCEGGLYINMKSLQAFCPEHLHIDYGRTGQDLYLLETGTKVCICAVVFCMSCVGNNCVMMVLWLQQT